MKYLFYLVLVILLASCSVEKGIPIQYDKPDGIYYVPRFDYYDYYDHYYNPYPYGFNYGFGLNYQYGPRYNDQHQFYRKPRLPKQEHRESPNKDKKDNKNYRPRYVKPEHYNNKSNYNVAPSRNIERPINNTPRNDSRDYSPPSNNSRSYSSPAPTNNSGGGNSGGSGGNSGGSGHRR